jgi:signal transduction histidine kinase
MELNKTKPWLYILTGLLLVIICSLGVWWLYLVIKLSNTLSELNIEHASEHLRLANIVKWEGMTFFFLLAVFTISIIYVYIQDSKKTRAIHAFFASLTHELKTPLASIRLQAEVIDELTGDDEKLQSLSKRLIEGTQRLEDELDKSLQLSRIERKGNLNLTTINLKEFLENFTKKFYKEINLNISSEGDDFDISADEFALNLIIRNLIENTYRHANKDGSIDVHLKSIDEVIELVYNDHGPDFTGDTSRLGQLFYKHESSKGSGIGLYLIKNLMEGMKGKFVVDSDPKLVFHLKFKKV